MVATPRRRRSAAPSWPNLGFEFRATNAHVQHTYSEGAGWDAGALVDEPYLKVHVGATALHYGQACFEGLKAFAQADGSVRLFRPYENAQRMANSCARLLMAAPPPELFVDACARAVAANREARERSSRAETRAPPRAEHTLAPSSLPPLSLVLTRPRSPARRETQFVPPYGSGGALYVRPLLFGSGARTGLQPADEYTFVVLVTPVRARRFHTTHVMTRNARGDARERARARARARARRATRPEIVAPRWSAKPIRATLQPCESARVV